VGGIYQILNTVNGKVYIGSAAYIKSRWTWHRGNLDKGTHHSILLQRAWNKYGANAFEFIMLEQVDDVTQLIIVEQRWMDATKCYIPKLGYNICKEAGRPIGYKHTKEAKAALSKSSTGRIKSPETRKKISDYQSNRTEEHKRNHSIAMKKRVFSPKHRANLTAANYRRKPVSDETRAKMSRSQKDRVTKGLWKNPSPYLK
jgi:group I intron endonuclease